MLQARLFSYIDTHYHRLGTNYGQLPINIPRECPARNYNYIRDGQMCYVVHSNGPNYYPNSFSGPEVTENGRKDHSYPVAGDVDRHDDSDDDNFTQAQMFWSKAMSETDRQQMCENIADNIIDCYPPILQRCLEFFAKVTPEFRSTVEAKLEIIKQERMAKAANTIPADGKA